MTPGQTDETLYKIGGTVTGLTGTLKLSNNGGDTVTVTASGSFQFPTGLKKGAAYSVTIAEAPATLVCAVSEGAGTVAEADVSSVAVACHDATFTVGGTVRGLRGTVQLANNGNDALSVTAAGAFQFATGLKHGAAYNVTVTQSPNDQICSVSSGQGTIDAANVASVIVTCNELAYSLGGTVTGLSGTLVLANSNDTVSLSTGTTSFTFTDPVAQGAPYAVSVKTQPAAQRCDITGATGAIDGGNVTTVAVSCTASHSVGVHVTNLTGDSLILTGNPNDVLTIAYDGSATTYDGSFAYHYVAGDPYTVTVTQNPQTDGGYRTLEVCKPTTSSGSVGSSDVVVDIACTQAYVLSVQVERADASNMVELSDGISPDIQSSSDSQTTSVSGDFQESYANQSAYSVSLVQGTGCVACPNSHQTANNTTLSGTFDGNDVTVTYACGVPCPQVN